MSFLFFVFGGCGGGICGAGVQRGEGDGAEAVAGGVGGGGWGLRAVGGR